jgi:sigma-E factor negative regulatory protein RseB
MNFACSCSARGQILLQRALPLFLLILLLNAPAGAVDFSQEDAIHWLSQMRQAVSRLNYKGGVAYLKDKQVESFQIVHVAADGFEQERLISMSTPLREVIRSKEKVTCYFPDAKRVFVENKPSKRSLLVELPENISALSRYYDLSLQRQEYVTQRLAQMVSIVPRDDYRYTRHLWVDIDLKLPLKFELTDEKGEVIEQMVFTSLEINGTISSRDLDPSTNADTFTWQTSHREMLPPSSLNWSLANVPEGFQIISYTRLKRPNTESPIDHILLSDGISSVSIYISLLEGEVSKTHPNKIGAMNAYFREMEDYRVTVMGEVPAKTVQTISEGLRYQEK